VLCWVVPDGEIAAAPVEGAVEGSVGVVLDAGGEVAPVAGVVVAEDSGVVVAVWVGAVVVLVVPVALAVLVVPAEPLVLLVIAALLGAEPFAVGVVVGVVAVVGGRGAPGAGGRVEVPDPVTSAPFLAASSTNDPASGVWMLPTARRGAPPGLAWMYPTAPGGGNTRPMLSARRSIR